MKKILLLILFFSVCGLSACGNKEYKGVEDNVTDDEEAVSQKVSENKDDEGSDFKEPSVNNENNKKDNKEFDRKNDNSKNNKNEKTDQNELENAKHEEQKKKLDEATHMFFDNRDSKKALAILNEIIADGCKEPMAFYTRAVIKNHEYDSEGALKDFNMIPDSDFDSICEIVEFVPGTGYTERAQAKYYSGDVKGALNDVNIVINRFERASNKENPPFLTYSFRAKIKRETGDKKGAEEDQKKFEELKPAGWN